MVKFTRKQLKGMNRMLVENKIEKLCCFYVSDFHLEMILLPYINKRLDENIIIKTEKDLRDTVETLVSKMNLNQENKDKILSLSWNNEDNNDRKIKNESNIIIIGNKNYIADVNKQIMQKNLEDLTIVDCYNFEEIKDDIKSISEKYDGSLNTSGLKV